MGAALVLRDIHQPPPPPWWPPAPGWWLLAALVLALAAWGAWRGWRRRARRRALAAWFDRALAEAGSPPAQVAAISELLRRAARRLDPRADRLQGEEWLAFLDASPPGRRARRAPSSAFRDGPGRLLLDGAYRRDVDPRAVAALRALARVRFLQWMDAA